MAIVGIVEHIVELSAGSVSITSDLDPVLVLESVIGFELYASNVFS